MGGGLLLGADIIPQEVVSSLISPYFSSCQYLKEASFVEDENGLNGIAGKFCIPESCYVESSGHFNAVEFIMCFNQMGYVLFGDSVRRGLAPEMGLDSLEDFIDVQLQRAYIVRVKEMSFRKPINPRDFGGSIHITRKKNAGGSNFYLTEVAFQDSTGGKATGLINLAMAGS